MNKKILLIGGGGHCKSVLDSLLDLDEYDDIGIIDTKENVGKAVLGTPILGYDRDLPSLYKDGYHYAFVAVGSIGNPSVRIRLFNTLCEMGFIIPNIVDASAKVSKHSQIDKGVFIGKHVVVNAGAVIGQGAIIFIAAGFCILLSIPLATLPFLALAALFIIVGLQLKKQSVEVEKQEEIQIEKNEVEEIRKPENVVNLLQVDPIELEFGYGIIPLADVNQGGDLLDRVVMIRRQLALELGMIVPIIRLRDNIQLNPNEYVIKIKGVEVAGGELMLDHYLAMSPGFVEEEIEGIKTTEPAFGLPAVWITEAQRDKAEMLGYTVVDPPSIIATHLTEVIKAHAHELTGRQEVQTIIDKVKENYPAIVEELVPKVMTIGEIQKVIANLLKEGVSVRDIVTILETLADYAPITHDTDMLTEYVRQALGRAISKKFIRDKKSTVITLDPKT